MIRPEMTKENDEIQLKVIELYEKSGLDMDEIIHSLKVLLTSVEFADSLVAKGATGNTIKEEPDDAT